MKAQKRARDRGKGKLGNEFGDDLTDLREDSLSAIDDDDGKVFFLCVYVCGNFWRTPGGKSKGV